MVAKVFRLNVGSCVWLLAGILGGVLCWNPALISQEKTDAEKPAAAIAEPTKPKPKKNRRSKPENRFEVPQTSDASVLVKFVRELDDFVPSSEAEFDAISKHGSVAIRAACQRILDLEKNEGSAARQFAVRRLLQSEFDDLAEQAAEKIPANLIERAEKYLASSSRQQADAEFALTVGSTVEELGSAQQAQEFYSRSGKMFAENRDQAIAKLGQTMIGAGRRMGLSGQPMEIKGTTLAGQPFDLASLKGKVVLVDFWTTWCGFCIDEFPNLKRNYLAYKSKGFEIVSINCDEDRETLDNFLKLNSLPWITLHDDAAGADQPAAIHYGISGFPSMFLLDREGKLVTTDARGRTLRKELKKLLGPPESVSTTNRRFPLVNNDELIDNLMDAAEELIAAGKIKDLAELRKNLGRKRVDLQLAPEKKERLSDREAYRQLAESVFIVGGLHRADESEEWDVALATAFAVSSDGVLSTSCHVFLDDIQLQGMVAMDLSGRIFPVEEILAADEATDTCFFRIPATGLKPISFGSEAVPGESLRIIGHPGNMFYYLSSGQVANYFMDDDGIAWMNVSADFGQGSSGAPVLDECGNVVGQVSRTMTLFAVGEEETAKRKRALQPIAFDARARGFRKSQLDELVSSTVSEPQMVFKSCVPVESMKKLVGK